MVELKLFNHGLGIQVFKILEILGLSLFFLNVFDSGHDVTSLWLFVRLFVLLVGLSFKGVALFFFPFQRYFFKKAFDLVEVMLSELVLVALDFYI